MYAKLTISALLAALVSCSAELTFSSDSRVVEAGSTSDPLPTSRPSKKKQPTSQPSAALFKGAKLPSEKFDHYGAGVAAGAATPVADLLQDPTKFETVPVRIEGDIVSVCKKKGCWVKVGDADKNLFVKFKDYGFFLPTDATGHIVLEGHAKVTTVSVEDQRHYLEDEGKNEEAKRITEPKTEVRFLAHGAAIKKGD